jgi:hypothetical protein
LQNNPQLLETPAGKVLSSMAEQYDRETNPAKKRLLAAHLQQMLDSDAELQAIIASSGGGGLTTPVIGDPNSYIPSDINN